MRIDWDVPITMDDGVVLRADIFRPDADGRYPVIMTHGPYAKGLSFQQAFRFAWSNLEAEHPDALAGSSNRYQNWETVDPEKWVPDGYVVIRVDARGSGRSPGYVDIFSPREASDYYTCIEWAGVQQWSNGKVGLLGISYYAVNQWQVAALQPPHLAAICPWEGATDYYREFTHHGGIPSDFLSQWFPPQVEAMQHGVGDRGARNPVTGVPVAGPETLDPDVLEKSRADVVADMLARPILDDYYRDRSADLTRITVPTLSATNWGHHLHTRGGFEGYNTIPAGQKWLEVHGQQHWVEFYTDYGMRLQKRFFGYFLKDEDTGWRDQPPVYLNLRRVDGTFAQRAENEWPLARTAWTTFHLDVDRQQLDTTPPRSATSVDFAALGDGVTLWTDPLSVETEITGPASAHLTVASSTTDADLFLVLRVQDPNGRDVTFPGAMDPDGAIAFGWLRASLRATDPALSTPYRPWQTYTESQPLTPGQPVGVDMEIWPTSVIIPAGYRLGVTLCGRDFTFAGEGPWPEAYGVRMRGNGIFVHTDERARPHTVFGGTTTLFTGGQYASSLLLPIIPATGRSAG
jgi:predicted acyl esterase